MTEVEQCGFRQGKGYVDQIFALCYLNEKACEKGRQLYLCFIDLKQAYDRGVRKGVWELMDSVGRHTLGEVKSLYEGCGTHKI